MSDILDKLSKILDPSGLLVGDDVKGRATDWMGMGQRKAKAIVRPKTTTALSEILAACHSAGQSVVGAGGLTGLVHATDTQDDDIVISFERMSGIENIDVVARTMTVLAGTPLQAVQDAAAEAGLLYAVDLGARGSASIGGNISTNAGGNQVIRYGMTRANVLGLEAVLADGTVLSSMNTLLKNNSGYDLKQLFIGSEGTLGMVSRAVLRLHPQPKSENTALIALNDFDSLITLFKFIGRELGGNLSAFEVMWKTHYELLAVTSGRHTAPIPAEYEYYVIVEAHGTHEARDSERFTEVLGNALEDGLALDAVIASSKQQRQDIWNIREDFEGLVMSSYPAVIFDVSLPIAEMKTYTENLVADLDAEWGEDCRHVIFGHLGDGNLHLGVAPRPWSEDARRRAEEIVYGPLEAIGGSVSAEHGIGLEKKPYLHLCRSPEEIATMRAIKAALDPKGILNPGKIF